MSKEKASRILGIDPGTCITGYGVISIDGTLQLVDYGCIKPPPKEKLTERYRILFEAVTALLHEHQPMAMAIETQYVQKNPQSSLKLGMARGVLTLAATLQEIPVFEYSPSRAKKAVVGNGKASKGQVQGMISNLLRLNAAHIPEDAADALALAICHAHAEALGWHQAHTF